MTGIGWKEKAPHLAQKTWKREIKAKKSTVLTGEQFWHGNKKNHAHHKGSQNGESCHI